MAGKMQQPILPVVVTFWFFKDPREAKHKESEVLSHRTNLRRQSNQRPTQQLWQSSHTDRTGCRHPPTHSLCILCLIPATFGLKHYTSPLAFNFPFAFQDYNFFQLLLKLTNSFFIFLCIQKYRTAASGNNAKMERDLSSVLKPPVMPR